MQASFSSLAQSADVCEKEQNMENEVYLGLRNRMYFAILFITACVEVIQVITRCYYVMMWDNSIQDSTVIAFDDKCDNVKFWSEQTVRVWNE